MTWVKLDDGFPEHQKALTAGDDACWLFVAALCYSARNLTDGFIPDAQVARLTSLRGPQRLAQRLVNAGLFEVVDGGYAIHDYGDYQPTKEQVVRTRESTAERVRKHRGNTSRNAVTNGSETPPPHGGGGTGTVGAVVEALQGTATDDARALHPKLTDIIAVLEAAKGPRPLLVEPLAVDAVLRGQQDRDHVRAAHDVAAMVIEGRNRTTSASSLLASVLANQRPQLRAVEDEETERQKRIAESWADRRRRAEETRRRPDEAAS